MFGIAQMAPTIVVVVFSGFSRAKLPRIRFQKIQFNHHYDHQHQVAFMYELLSLIVVPVLLFLVFPKKAQKFIDFFARAIKNERKIVLYCIVLYCIIFNDMALNCH